MYALANDENGNPIEVPATATGWLVRRHAGGKGRPGAVYDADGRPLVVELGATARELRAHGCAPGPYRLEAVDPNRRPMGVVAFTEIVGDDGAAGEGAAKTAGSEGAAVAALARAVEAMQRVQAQREQSQSEMFMRLIDRLAPAPAQPAQNLRNAVVEFAEVQKAMKKLVPEPAPQPAPTVVIEEREPVVAEESNGWAELATKLALQHAPGVVRFVLHKMGLKAEEIAILTGGIDAVVNASAAAPANDSATRTPSAPPNETAQKLAAIFELLTPEEGERMRGLVNKLSVDVMDKAEATMLSMSPQDAVSFLRKTFLRGANAPTEKAA